jgi:beta-xylosidase
LTTYGCEIDLSTGRSLSKPVLLRASDATASLQATDEGGGIAEGPHIYKIDGWYYLLTAEGGTSINHQVWIARSKSPLGPYEQPPAGVNPLVYNAEDPTVQATGHADIFEGTDGRWWICMLARRVMAHGKSQLGRETYLAPMEWKDGWPLVNGGKSIGLTVDATGLPEKTTPKEWRDDFKSGKYLLYSTRSTLILVLTDR